MKARLNQLLDVEHLSPSKFADLIGVQRSSVSHVLSGRNNPSFDFLAKTLKAFPDLNADWLILGEGAMYDRKERPDAALFMDENRAISQADHAGSKEPELFKVGSKETEKQKDSKKNIGPADKSPPAPKEESGDQKLVRVVLFYDDDTFHSYEPED